MDAMHCGEFRPVLGDPGQQFHFIGAGNLDHQRARFFVQPAQCVGQGRTGQHLDGLAGKIRQPFRAHQVVVADDPLCHGADRDRELQGFVAQWHRRGQVNPAGKRQVIEFVLIGGLDELHFKAQAVGKGSNQVMLVAAGGGTLVLEECRGFADCDDQSAMRLGRFDAGAGRKSGECETADQAKQFRQRFTSVHAVTD